MKNKIQQYRFVCNEENDEIKETWIITFKDWTSGIRIQYPLSWLGFWIQFLAKNNPDPGLSTSNEGRVLKFDWMNK